jgi:hypothetical protein
MRQGAHDLYLVIGQERHEVVLRRQLEHRQVAAVDHVPAARLAFLHEPPEIRVQLGRPAGDVHDGNGRPVERVEAQLHRVARHYFAAIRPGVHVTVTARLVAQLPHIDLKDLDGTGEQRSIAGARHGLVELAGERQRAEACRLDPGGGERQVT